MWDCALELHRGAPTYRFYLGGRYKGAGWLDGFQLSGDGSREGSSEVQMRNMNTGQVADDWLVELISLPECVGVAMHQPFSKQSVSCLPLTFCQLEPPECFGVAHAAAALQLQLLHVCRLDCGVPRCVRCVTKLHV